MHPSRGTEPPREPPEATEGTGPGEARQRATAPSLEGLTVAGITRRRVAWLLGGVIAAWIVIVFARQVGEASAKSAQADQARLANAQVTDDVASLQHELDLIQRQAYIEQAARGLGLGAPTDHPFALAPGAPALAANAPGSAAMRLGAQETPSSPLEVWLSLLFGPTPSN
jgi:hypothetical protein